MRHVPSLVAALLLPTAQHLLLSAAVSTGTLLVSQAPARAQSAEAVAKVAQAITVRIEGATQGSGVLVKRDGNRYTVLTAWHVVSGQRPGEELDIITSDGKEHSVYSNSIRRIDIHDLAELTFYSSDNYLLARLSMGEPAATGMQITTCGFSAHRLQASSSHQCTPVVGTLVGISIEDNGLPSTLRYNAPTEQGFSGGAVLDSNGSLIGIHTKGYVDEEMTEVRGITVKTGVNTAQGVYSTSFVGLGLITPEQLIAAQDKHLSTDRVKANEKSNPGGCSQKNSLALECQGRSRDTSGQVLVETGLFKTIDITRAKERRCNRDTMMIVNTMFNLALPWNWFKSVDNNCVGYTFKARFYAESSAQFCGVIISRYGPNYEMTTTRENYAERGGKLESDLLELWDQLKSDRMQGRAYISRNLIYGILSLGNAESARFLPPGEVPDASPALIKGSIKLFQVKEAHRSQPMIYVNKLKNQEARSDNLILASMSPVYYEPGLSLYFDDGSSYLMRMGSKDLRDLRGLLKRCL
jgi:hypothetical protein